MRDTSGRSRRVSTKLKAAFVALLAIFAVSAAGATAASADTVEYSFDQGWIKILPVLLPDGMEAVTTDGPKVTLKNGTVTGNNVAFAKDALSFPSQQIPMDQFGVTSIDLSLTAAEAFSGTFDRATGAATVNLPLNLQIDTKGTLEVSCAITPLQIPFATSGSVVLPGGTHNGAAFSPNGALVGQWAAPTADMIKTGSSPGPDQDDAFCADTLPTILSAAGITMADLAGEIWLGGSATYTAAECPTGQTGTPPDCVTPPVATPFSLSKIVVTPKKAKAKAGKKLKLKVKVTNSGGTAGSATIALKSSNKQVKVPKKLKVSIAAGKTVTKTITVKISKKAKGKANITAKANGKSAKTVVTVQKAKKKKK